MTEFNEVWFSEQIRYVSRRIALHKDVEWTDSEMRDRVLSEIDIYADFGAMPVLDIFRESGAGEESICEVIAHALVIGFSKGILTVIAHKAIMESMEKK